MSRIKSFVCVALLSLLMAPTASGGVWLLPVGKWLVTFATQYAAGKFVDHVVLKVRHTPPNVLRQDLAEIRDQHDRHSRRLAELESAVRAMHLQQDEYRLLEANRRSTYQKALKRLQADSDQFAEYQQMLSLMGDLDHLVAHRRDQDIKKLRLLVLKYRTFDPETHFVEVVTERLMTLESILEDRLTDIDHQISDLENRQRSREIHVDQQMLDLQEADTILTAKSKQLEKRLHFLEEAWALTHRPKPAGRYLVLLHGEQNPESLQVLRQLTRLLRPELQSRGIKISHHAASVPGHEIAYHMNSTVSCRLGNLGAFRCDIHLTLDDGSEKYFCNLFGLGPSEDSAVIDLERQLAANLTQLTEMLDGYHCRGVGS